MTFPGPFRGPSGLLCDSKYTRQRKIRKRRHFRAWREQSTRGVLKKCCCSTEYPGIKFPAHKTFCLRLEFSILSPKTANISATTQRGGHLSSASASAEGRECLTPTAHLPNHRLPQTAPQQHLPTPPPSPPRPTRSPSASGSLQVTPRPSGEGRRGRRQSRGPAQPLPPPGTARPVLPGR